jgi:hypothetical protein
MEDDEPFDLETAWADLQHALFGLLTTIGGCVAALADRLILPRAARMEILQWLAPIEAIARRLLVIEALKLPPPNQPAPFVPKGRLASAYADRPEAVLSDNPKDWRVRFHTWSASAPTNKSANVIAALRAHAIQHNAIPLARRIEALRRLFDQRELYAQRLARSLHHAPTRAPRAFSPYRHRATAVLTLMRRTQAEADHALAALNSS